MGQATSLISADGFEYSAYVGEPDGAPRGGIVILQEIFGVTAHIKRVADLYASHGYCAIAPALYDRVQRDCALSYDDIEQARAMKSALSSEHAIADVAAAIDAARCGAGVATIGFCWGGTLAYLAACDLGIDAGVAYYGTNIAAHLDKTPDCPFLFHFGRKDPMVPMEHVERIQDANPNGIFHLYDAGHGFNCDERASFDPPSSELALKRTLAFLAETVG